MPIIITMLQQQLSHCMKRKEGTPLRYGLVTKKIVQLSQAVISMCITKPSKSIQMNSL